MRAQRQFAVSVAVAIFASNSVPGYPHTVDPVFTTDVSGYRATDVTWLAASVGEFALGDISWDEKGDKPCSLGVTRKSLYPRGTAGFGTGMNICRDGTEGLSLGAPKRVHFDSNPRYYIRGISTCTNNSNNHRLKGIRIYPASVSVDGVVNALNSSESAERTNCATWHAPVFCPAGQVASAVVVHHTSDEATGLALRCRRVVTD